MNGLKVFEVRPKGQKENVKYGVLIADVSSSKELGAIKEKRGEQLEFKRCFLKVSPGMKLRYNRRLGVFLQKHPKLAYHQMIFPDLEIGGGKEGEGRERETKGSKTW